MVIKFNDVELECDKDKEDNDVDLEGDKDKEDPNDVDDEEEDELEAENGDEELDAYEALDMVIIWLLYVLILCFCLFFIILNLYATLFF